MAQTPGFTLANDDVDSDRRQGVAIEWQYQAETSALIFNPATYAFLGAGPETRS